MVEKLSLTQTNRRSTSLIVTPYFVPRIAEASHRSTVSGVIAGGARGAMRRIGSTRPSAAPAGLMWPRLEDRGTGWIA